MPDTRRYVFAIADAKLFGPLEEITGLPAGFEPVRAVAADGLLAFVSTYRGPSIEEVAQTELTGWLLLHQRVIERLMHAGSLLPVRLGTLLDDDQSVASLLRGSRDVLRSAAEHYAGTVEVDVAATWDVGSVIAQIAEDPEVVAAKSTAAAAPAEGRSTAMIVVGQMVEAKLIERRDALESVVLGHLRPHASDVQLNSVISDELVCNVALLVGRSVAADIDAALNQLDAELEGRYSFRRIGPLPPYSFATVHVHAIPAEDVRNAMRVLSLAESFGDEAILEQYRVLALARHPDVSGATGSGAGGFEELTWARTTLLALTANRPDITRVPDSAVLYASVERSIGRN